MPRTFKSVGVSLPPELAELVDEVTKKLYGGNKSFVFRVALYHMLWDMERALEKAIELLGQGKDLEEEASKYEDDPNLEYYLWTIAVSELKKEELEELLEKVKEVKKKLRRNLYYI